MASIPTVRTESSLRFCDANRESGKSMAPIQGFENMPLVSLEVATAPLVPIVPQIKQMVAVVKSDLHDSAEGLTLEEAAAVKLYSFSWSTDDTSFYTILNKTLRAENRVQLKPWFLYLRLVLHALSKLPPMTSTTIFRGVREDLHGKYPPNSTPIWWGFTSCTTDLAVLSNDQFLGKTDDRTLFIIECPAGKSIAAYSVYPTEREVLLPPGIQFQVLSDVNAAPGLHLVHLKQIEPEFPLLATVSPSSDPSSFLPKHPAASSTSESTDRESADKSNVPSGISGQKPHARVPCFETNSANTCRACQRKIPVDEKDRSFREHRYHERCFVCSTCRVSLVDKLVGCKDEQLHCNECYKQKFAPRCAECSQILPSGTAMIEHGGKEYHERCFVCSACTTSLGTQGFVTKNNRRFCKPCHDDRFLAKCVHCHKPIISRTLNYRTQPWHPECFNCTNCQTPLADLPVLTHDEQPYCRNCSDWKFGPKCCACAKPIPSADKAPHPLFEGQHWHNQCFMCQRCGCSLVGQGFRKADSKIVCLACSKRN